MAYRDIKQSKISVVLRTIGALIRAVLVGLTILLPSVILGDSSNGAELFSLVFATMVASVIFVEYLVEAPAIIEFRFAAPYNRLRFMLILFLALVVAAGVKSGITNSDETSILDVLQSLAGTVMSGWISPVNSLVLAMGDNEKLLNGYCTDLAAFSLLFSIFASFLFGFWLWIGSWPLSKMGFNLWPNMPGFSVRAGQVAASRLIRVACLSFALAMIFPYLLPFLIAYGRVSLGVDFENSSITVFWVIFIWSAVPALTLLRSISLLKLAFLAENLRKF